MKYSSLHQTSRMCSSIINSTIIYKTLQKVVCKPLRSSSWSKSGTSVLPRESWVSSRGSVTVTSATLEASVTVTLASRSPHSSPLPASSLSSLMLPLLLLPLTKTVMFERRSGGAPWIPLSDRGGEEGGGLPAADCSVEEVDGGDGGGGGEDGDSGFRELMVPSRLSVEFSTELTGV